MPIFYNKKLNSAAFQDQVCQGCGLRFVDFEHAGLLGCPQCYTSFMENLMLMLQRIHGSHKHIGSRPVNMRKRYHSQNIGKLKLELTAAIATEQYEKAAELRDIIKDMERQL